jgi:hypothetical protein
VYYYVGTVATIIAVLIRVYCCACFVHYGLRRDQRGYVIMLGVRTAADVVGAYAWIGCARVRVRITMVEFEEGEWSA